MRSLYLLYKYCKTADKFFPLEFICVAWQVCRVGRGREWVGGVRWTYYFGLHSARVYAKLRLNATTAARHGTARQVPWLKVSKELHMLSHMCVCVASFPFSPHTGRQQQPRCHALCLSACSCCFCSFIVNLWLPLCCARTHSLTLTPHAVHRRPLCE